MQGKLLAKIGCQSIYQLLYHYIFVTMFSLFKKSITLSKNFSAKGRRESLGTLLSFRTLEMALFT